MGEDLCSSTTEGSPDSFPDVWPVVIFVGSWVCPHCGICGFRAHEQYNWWSSFLGSATRSGIRRHLFFCVWFTALQMLSRFAHVVASVSASCLSAAEKHIACTCLFLCGKDTCLLPPFGSCEDCSECSHLPAWVPDFRSRGYITVFWGTVKPWTVPGGGSMWKISSWGPFGIPPPPPLGEKIHCLVLCLKFTEKRRSMSGPRSRRKTLPALPPLHPHLDCQDPFYVKDTLEPLPLRFSNQSVCKLSTHSQVTRKMSYSGELQFGTHELSKQEVQIQRKGSPYCRSQEGLSGLKAHWQARV